MVWNIMHDVDLETAKATSLEKRVSSFQQLIYSSNLMEIDFYAFMPPGSVLGIVRADGRPIFSRHGTPLLHEEAGSPQTPRPICQKFLLSFQIQGGRFFCGFHEVGGRAGEPKNHQNPLGTRNAPAPGA